MKHLLLTTIAAVLLGGTALAFRANAQTSKTIEKATEEFIEANDINDDGKLSIDEFPERIRRKFDKVDTDNDGLVSAKENKAYRASRSSGKKRKERNAERRTERDGDTRIERDIVYATVNGRDLLLDLYISEKVLKPADAKHKDKLLPVIVWIHGGGWKGGSKGSGGIARGAVDRGYALIDVEYRLSGEAIFPAQFQDCKAAVRWVRANSHKYGLNPKHIGVMGRSAGGHLVAFLGTSGDTDEFDTDSNAGHSSRVQAVCDLWGPTDLLQMDAHNLEGARLIHDSPESPESRLVGGPIQKEPYRSLAVKANPIKYITKGQDLPPFLIVHGDSDLSVPPHQSQLLYDALIKAEGDATLRFVKKGGHGLKGGDMSYKELLDVSIAFFDKHLKPTK